MTASNATPAAGTSVGNINAPATRATGRNDKTFTKWKPRPMIKPAPEDYVIVIKPRERVSLHEAFTETAYGTAFSAYLGPERARATSVLPSRDQNSIIVYTQDIEAADRLIGDFAVNTEKGSVPLHGYLRQDGGNTCPGVIVVRNTDTTETLQHRVCWRAGTIAEIRKFGTYKARITFAGKEKPRYVHHDNMVVSVQNYYKTIPAIGHRADACPNFQPNTCGLCGLHAPLVEGVRAPHNCVPRCSVCGGAHATNFRDCAAKFRTPKMAAKKGGKKKMTPKNKSRHLGQPSDQPPPHDCLEKRAAETHGKTGAWVNAVKNELQVSNSGGAAASPPPPPPLTPLPSARSAQQDQIAALRAQNEMLLKKINELESKTNQPLSPPSFPATKVMEIELVEPKAATSAETAFEARFEACFGAIDARFATLENEISMMVAAISRRQDTIPAMIAQQISHSSRPSRRPGGPYKDVSGHALKTSRRPPEVDDDDSCSLSGMEGSAVLIRRSPKTNSATPVHIVHWNCRSFRSRAKRVNLRLFLSTLDSLPAVVALQEPGSGATLTSNITFQQDPSSCRVAEYAAPLADLNWVDRCNTAARQLSSRNTWRLSRALIDPTQTRAETQKHLQRAIHSFDGDTSKLAYKLRDQYLCTQQDPRGPAYSYAGSENAELDQPIQLHDLKAALAKIKRGTAPGRDKITVKLLANLPDPTYDSLLAFINSI
ncbi:hypothetical protein HPB49_008921 [Dermacentor silvarum]|uniref:Uncharacterized protein n=1 Tax=Dermacentor silvarum TaxID=543639 RepID=A0ACB8CQN2_DERSI|nr:hypothetical protein HPB49_008921 [Dermacentor silvarum]